jgi:hypothetical protein
MSVEALLAGGRAEGRLQAGLGLRRGGQLDDFFLHLLRRAVELGALGPDVALGRALLGARSAVHEASERQLGHVDHDIGVGRSGGQ